MRRLKPRAAITPQQLSQVPSNSKMSMILGVDQLDSALRQNKFRNMFEGGEGSVGEGRDTYEYNRLDTEEALHGIPQEAHGHLRPIYGLLRARGNAANTMDDGLYYGNTMVDFKEPDAPKNITYTEGDSLNKYLASPLDKEGWAKDPEKLPKVKQLNPYVTNDPENNNYTELQFHDRPKPRTDISAVHIKAISDYLSEAKFNQNTALLDSREKALRDAGYAGPIHRWRTVFTRQPSLFEGVSTGYLAEPKTTDTVYDENRYRHGILDAEDV